MYPTNKVLKDKVQFGQHHISAAPVHLLCVTRYILFYRHQFVENNLILKMGPVDKRKVSYCSFCVSMSFYTDCPL